MGDGGDGSGSGSVVLDAARGEVGENCHNQIILEVTHQLIPKAVASVPPAISQDAEEPHKQHALDVTMDPAATEHFNI